MELLLLVWRQYRWPFVAVLALSLASAAMGIGLIAFINQRLIESVDLSVAVLPEFLGLLLLLMAVTLGSQLALTTLVTTLSTACVANLSSVFWIRRSSASNSLAAPRCWPG